MSMKRRQFLASSLATLPLAFTRVPIGLPSSPLFSALLSDPSDRVMVIINLVGGNDGLNTVIPIDQVDNLAAVRSNLLLSQNRLLNLNATTALHAGMSGMRSLWDNAKLGIVQGVGYPNQNRSHFRSTDIWNSASASKEVLQTGWLGRYFDTLHPGFPEGYPNASSTDPAAISLGNVASETCQGLLGTFALTVNNPLNLTSLLEGSGNASPDNEYGHELDYVRTTIAQTNAYGSAVQARAREGRNVIDYPANNSTATNLKYVAQMISGGLKTKAYIVTLGGFDTHAGQVDADDTNAGKHANLLTSLSEAVTAFMADITALGLSERVIGMTYSEFGRRIRSNSALGTDHGSAAPMFLFGDCVNAGILGQNPTIDSAVDDQEGVPMQYDFRDIYGSILEDWFGLDPTGVRALLYADYQKLPILRNCNTPNAVRPEEANEGLSLTATPNPFANQVELTFTTAAAGRVSLSAYDVQGAEIETLFNRRLPAGEQKVNVDTSAYPTGVVIFRLRENGRVRVLRGIKL